MKMERFLVEEWMNQYETNAQYNIAETCVDSVSLDELFALTHEDKQAFLDNLSQKRLTYGAIEGLPELKAGIARLYQTVQSDEIVTTHGASGANHHVFYTAIEPGDHVIVLTPTYQQLYSIPESFGAEVECLHLEEKDGYLPNLDRLAQMVRSDTKMICINNPNNPTGALMPKEVLQQIVAIAKKVNAYVLCDEVYRHLTQEDSESPSIVDLYEKGISVSSMSKVFSLAGVRLGWIVSHDKDFIRSCFSHRDYNLVSCGMLDEAIAALALQHQEEILARNRQMVRTNLAILDQWVQNEKHVQYAKPQAGTTALIRYDIPVDSVTMCQKLYAFGAFVTPGDCFLEPYSFRVGYACESDVLEKGLAMISACFQQM